MGKKPLVGVVGSLCLGLSLAGCESSGSKPVYQGQTGAIRNNWANNSSQTTPQGALQPAPTTSTTQATGASQPTSTAQTTQGWSNTPRSSTGTTMSPSYGGGTASPMPAGPPSNAGTFVPTGGVDNGKGYPPPVSTGAGTTGPVSSNGWPMNKAGDSGIMQTSGTAPMGDTTQTGMLPVPPLPKSSLVAPTRTTDAYGSSTMAPPATANGSRMLPPPPPVMTGSGQAPADALSSAPPPPAAKAFMDPPPAVSSIPANDLPPLPPPPAAIQVPPPPAK